MPSKEVHIDDDNDGDVSSPSTSAKVSGRSVDVMELASAPRFRMIVPRVISAEAMRVAASRRGRIIDARLSGILIE